MQETKKIIKKGIGKLMVLLAVCFVMAGAAYAKDKEADAKSEPASTQPGMEMLGKQTGRAILLEDGESFDDISLDDEQENMEESDDDTKEGNGKGGINARATLGSTCYISWGDTVEYFDWFTRKFSIQSDTGTHVAYCAQPSLSPVAGAHTVYELNDDRIKAVMICNPWGPEPWNELWQDQIVGVSDDARYGIAHAVIGFYYTGGTEGFYDGGVGSPYHTVFHGIPNEISKWMASHQTTLDQYNAYVAKSSGQDIVWLEKKPMGNVTIKKASANIVLTDHNTCYSLKNAEYGVYSDSGCAIKVGTLTTKEDGSTNTLRLDTGTYYVKELTAPKGYEQDKELYKVSVKENQTTTLTVSDEPQKIPVTMLLTKYDTDKGYAVSGNLPQGCASLAGAEYTFRFYGTHEYGTLTELQAAEKAGKVNPLRTWVFVTDENGLIYMTEEYLLSGDGFWKDMSGKVSLPQGVLTIQETKAPEGYLQNEEVLFQKIGSMDNSGNIASYQVAKVSESVKKGNIRIVKFRTDPDDTANVKRPMEGITFVLQCDGNADTYTVTTDKNGEGYLEDIPYGTYTVTEINAPAQYAAAKPFKVKVTEHGETKTYIVENREIKAAVSVVKKDAASGETIPMAGTKFKLLDQDKNPITMQINYPSRQELEIFETDAYGAFTFPERLGVGTYYLEEVLSPEGYLKGELLEFQITDGYDWDEPLVLTYMNEAAKGKITLLKLSGIDEEPLEGVEFTIKAAQDITTGDGIVHAKEGEVVGIMTTDAEGRAESQELHLGRYEVQETKAKDGFVRDETIYGVHLAYIDQETELVIKDMGTLINVPTELRLTKVRKGTDQALEGVVFAVWEQGMDEEEEYVTDENGQIHLQYLKSGVTYYVEEVEALPGYVPNEEVLEITVDENGRIDGEACAEVVVENDYTKILSTKAADKATNSQRSIIASEAQIVDKVYLEGLIPGETYTLRGKQMLQEEEKPVENNGEVIWGETTFVAESQTQYVEVEFTLDSSELAGKITTIYEYLYLQDALIDSHEDIANKDQMISYEEAPAKEVSVKEVPPAKTGDQAKIWLWFGALLAMAAIVVKILKRR